MPVFGILYCGDSFEFYKFDGSFNSPKVFRGYHGTEYQFRLPNIHYANDPQCYQQFLCSLHIVTEIIFDVFLMAYSSSLKTYSRKEHSESAKWLFRNNIKWEKAIKYAEGAQQMFRDGEIKHKAGDDLEAMQNLGMVSPHDFMSCNSGLSTSAQAQSANHNGPTR